ncbi:MAG TPA: chemotaxis protein CheW [Ktedonobacteraceae bacterium]|nr:chemotaxis protein CheW [Ktedonobacteraceae bacterium]
MAFQNITEARSLEQMTDEEFWKHARSRAGDASRGISSSEAGPRQYLECELQRGKCFIPLDAIEEVIPAPFRLARLPLMPRWMPGVLALRGEIMAVVNLDEYLSDIDTPFSGGMLLVARLSELTIGLRVPAVGLIITIEPEQITSSLTPSMSYTAARAAIVKEIYMGCPVLDVAALLNDVTLQVAMVAHHA